MLKDIYNLNEIIKEQLKEQIEDILQDEMLDEKSYLYLYTNINIFCSLDNDNDNIIYLNGLLSMINDILIEHESYNENLPDTITSFIYDMMEDIKGNMK